ncbi:MAG TPA: MFS transporter [Zeimonas sp.]|nr:MFS transporter [Zeimonas sp.]
MPAMPDMTAAGSERAIGRAIVLVGAGMVAALNVGKLPPALPVLQQEFGLSLVQVSWMVSLFLAGSALLGLVGGSLADRFDPRRVMIGGLALSAATGALGAAAPGAPVLFLSRALESVAFMLTVLPAPALLRQVVPGASLRGWLGVWATYMPTGMGIALLVAPALMAVAGWRGVWAFCAAVAAAWALLVAATQPRRATQAATPAPIGAVALATLRSRGPWLLALCFGFYAGQFTGIFSFLPSVYAEYGVSAQLGASLTALAVLSNGGGGLAAGLLLQRGVDRASLVVLVGITMAVCAWLAFGSGLAFGWRYAAIVVLSTVGGLIPGALFATAPFYAPSIAAVSTTVGLMQQGSGVGQILLPPAIAALAQYTGGWSSTWIATGAAALVTVALGLMIRRYDAVRPR